MFMRASGASEVENFDILHTKSAIFRPIFCRFFRYFVGTNDMQQLMVWRYIQGGPKITERHTSGNKDIR